MSDVAGIDDTDDTAGNGTEQLQRWHGLGWVLLLWATTAVAIAISNRPQVFDGPLDTVFFVAAIVLLVTAGTLAFTPAIDRRSSGARFTAAVVALLGWTTLMFVDDRWSLTLFTLYAVCYSLGIRLGLPMAAYVSVVWAAAMLVFDAPLWAVVMPLGVFTVSSILAVTIQRISELNERKSELIAELRATQRDLVDAERSKGVLAERTRMAAEIHDTLAQGFTSIVLLSRAGLRSGDATEALKSIEETAQENLADSRRLIEAIRPPELNAGSLPMALERQLESVLPDGVDGRFTVEGEPRPLNGTVEVTVLRAAQEALLNIRTHARADRVHMVLRFTADSVELDVRDNGVGFAAGDVADRGELTGGQGLGLLRRRAESLSGHLAVGPASWAASGTGASNGSDDSGGSCRGSQLSLTLPVSAP